ncbi:hypothetical protein AOLI_G00304110 [Acnodon oligacanthus]
MDFVVKKIQELDVSRPRSKGRHKNVSQEKSGKVDNGSRSLLKTGCENLTDSLRVQSIAVKSSLSRPRSSFSGLLPESDTPQLGPSKTAREPKGETMKATLPSKVENIPVMADMSNQVEPQQLSVYPLEATTSTVPFFIRSVTAVELVCGERRYKCLGCLRYYDHLASLLEHIQQGWTEGFSCGVFYRKLRSMHESRGSMSGHRLETLSRCKPQLSDPSLAVSPAETHKSCSTRDKKTDMICKWLQTAEIRAVPE